MEHFYYWRDFYQHTKQTTVNKSAGLHFFKEQFKETFSAFTHFRIIFSFISTLGENFSMVNLYKLNHEIYMSHYLYDALSYLGWVESKVLKYQNKFEIVLNKELLSYKRKKGILRWFLTHFSPVSHFYTPWKRQKTCGFLTFLGGIETWHWTKMG